MNYFFLVRFFSDDESGDEIGPLPPAPEGERGEGTKDQDDEPPPSKKQKTASAKKLPYEKEYLQDLPCW